MGLSPKPERKLIKKYDWSELQSRLDAVFNNEYDPNPKLVIDSQTFDIPLDEIVKEGEKNGYHVEINDNFIYFT